jgi:hypothetical protein
MEVLVALGITSLIATLVLQLLVQAARLDAQAGRGLAEGAPLSLRETWLRDALGSAQASAWDGLPPFSGQPSRLEFISPDSILPLGPGLSRMALELQVSPGPSVLLSAKPADWHSEGEAIDTRAPLRLMAWPASAARFRFRDAAGSWHDRWPPSQPDPALPIPSALLIEIDGDSASTLIISNPNSSMTLPGRRDIGDD